MPTLPTSAVFDDSASVVAPANPPAAKDPLPGDQWQRIDVVGVLSPSAEELALMPAIGVDRATETIHGFIVAQEGPFKSNGRGEFDRQSLDAIRKLMAAAPSWLKSRFTHPDLSNDGLGKFLGRVTDPRLDFITHRESQGQLKMNRIAVVRGDLHIDPSSHDTPSGDIGKYVMDLAESDPDAMSSSLVLKSDQEFRLKPDGTRQTDIDGELLPPLWRPVALHAVDVVDTGDAVDGLLSANFDAESLPDSVVRQASALMDRQFAGKPPEFVRDRCIKWLNRFLVRKFGLADNYGEWPADLAMGDGDGPVKPDGAVDDPAKHDGCRSAKGLHYQKECRQCGKIIDSCGCKDRLRESRMIRMGTCPDCLTPDNPKSPADDFQGQNDPDNPQGYDSHLDPQKRSMELKASEMETEAELW